MTFEEIVNEALSMVQIATPYRTGNLRRSFKVVDYGDYVGIRTEVPYMVYTNEEWTYNSRWGKTLTNKRQGWFDNAVLLIAEMIARELGGIVDVGS